MHKFYLDLFRQSDRSHITVIATTSDLTGLIPAIQAAEARHPGYKLQTWFFMSSFINYKPTGNEDYITVE